MCSLREPHTRRKERHQHGPMFGMCDTLDPVVDVFLAHHGRNAFRTAPERNHLHHPRSWQRDAIEEAQDANGLVELTPGRLIDLDQPELVLPNLFGTETFQEFTEVPRETIDLGGKETSGTHVREARQLHALLSRAIEFNSGGNGAAALSKSGTFVAYFS